MAGADDTPQKVEARLVLLDGATISGVLAELGARTITVATPLKRGPEVESGSRLHFELSGDLVGGSHVADGHVDRCWQHGNTRRYTLRYAVLDDFERLLATRVGRHFNRRDAYRVIPADTQPVLVEVTPPDASTVICRALDVSAGGVAVPVAGTPLAALEPGAATLELTLRLPGSPRPVELVGRVRFAGEEEGAQRLGIAFDEDRSRGFAAAQDRVIDYVMKRQREELREARARERKALI